MSGYWVVEVTEKNGDSHFASESYGAEEARFENQEDAEELAEEVLLHHERVAAAAEKLMMFSRSTGVKVCVAFVSEGA